MNGKRRARRQIAESRLMIVYMHAEAVPRRCRVGAETVPRRCRGGAEAVLRRCKRK